MSDSTTNLPQVVAGANADVRVNELFDAASPALLYGRNAATTAGLTWGYLGGRLDSAAIANGTLTLGASTTSYIVGARVGGAVTSNTATTDWNNSTDFMRLYKVVTGASTITSYEDHRQPSGGTGGGGSGAGPLAINTKTTSYPLVLTDAEDAILMNVATANSLTVPPNSSVAFPVGTSILIAQKGAGLTTVVAGAGVTIRTRSPLTLALAGQYAQAALLKVATDEWYLSGDLA